MKKIKITSILEVTRISYMQIFCKIKGTIDSIIGTKPDADILIRHPDLCISRDDLDELIFNKGDLIKITIESMEKDEKEKKE